jgi:hypothetical protein
MENKLIYKKMAEVMASIGAVGKNSTNTMQGYKFRGIDMLVNALHPALIKNGVFLAPKVTKHAETVREVTRANGKQGFDKHVTLEVEYTFYAEDGSYVTVGPVVGEAMDSGDKASNKALSAAFKYALIQTFSVPTEDMADADSYSPEIAASTAAKVVAPTVQAEVTTAAEVPKKVTFRKPKVVADAPAATTAIAEGWE